MEDCALEKCSELQSNELNHAESPSGAVLQEWE